MMLFDQEGGFRRCSERKCGKIFFLAILAAAGLVSPPAFSVPLPAHVLVRRAHLVLKIKGSSCPSLIYSFTSPSFLCLCRSHFTFRQPSKSLLSAHPPLIHLICSSQPFPPMLETLSLSLPQGKPSRDLSSTPFQPILPAFFLW